MESAAEERNTFSGEDFEEEYEEVEVEEEVEEVEEEVVEERQDRGLDKVDGSDRNEAKQAVNGLSSEGKIFVGGVAWETTEDSFHNHFKKYGEIIDSVIMKDKHTHKPRGFGFITFADPAVVDDVIKDEHVIDGRTVEIKRTVPRETMGSKEGPKTKKVFVGGIPPSLTEDEFKDYFSAYGKVAEHQIMLDHSTGRSRGFGFITFENENSVEQIMAEDKIHELGGKQVELKRAVPKKAGDSGSSGRGSFGYGGGGNMYSGYGGGGGHGYGGGQRFGGAYGGRAAAGGYGRGYGYGAGAGPGYGYDMGFGSGYGGPMYGYGAMYGGQGAYGAFYDTGGGGAGGAYGGGGGGTGGAYGGGGGGTGGAYGGGRHSNRYNPYGR